MANLITFAISRWRERGDEAEARVRRAEGEKGDAVERMQRNVEALKQVGRTHICLLCVWKQDLSNAFPGTRAGGGTSTSSPWQGNCKNKTTIGENHLPTLMPPN